MVRGSEMLASTLGCAQPLVSPLFKTKIPKKRTALKRQLSYHKLLG